MQFEVEYIPMVLGFSVGTLLLCLQRFGFGRRVPCGRGKGGPKAGESLVWEAEPPSPMPPVGEPGPEPDCGELAPTMPEARGALTRRPTGSTGLQRGQRGTCARAAPVPTLVLGGADKRTCGLQSCLLASAALVAVLAVVAAALFVAVGLSVPPTASSDAGEPLAAPEAAPPQVAPALVADTAAGLSDTLLGGGDLPRGTPGDKVVTLNLTREQMATRLAGNVIYHKSAYWGTLAVGTPPVHFKVVFDTGSGHIILPSTYCRTPTCRQHTRYKRSMSTSATDIDNDGTVVKPGQQRDQISVGFGTGEVTGVFVEDVVCVSSSNVPGSTPDCKPMRLILATHMSEEPFLQFQFDGILGLGLSGLSQAPEFNFLHVMAGLINEMGGTRPNVFSVFLASHSYENSDLTLGGVVEEHMDGDLAWNSVLEPQLGHWLLAVKSIRVDDDVIVFCHEGCRAVVDTGTSLLSVPSPSFPELYELLRHEADAELGCKGPGPQFHIELESITLTLTPADYARPENQLGLQSSPMRPFLPPNFHRNETFTTTEYCKPMVMAMDIEEPVGPKLYVLGEPVLRKYYSVFDTSAHAPRIGFASAVHVPPPEGAEEDWDADDFDTFR
eukprot:CAMPEP_0179037670 /NCGR_PEP_ID=MMETSP0796-20121207/14246_1 /TAXON_ID=73915 /ORGANISM="Pyrodinium bahamense, Strain pbaha01" /LENGTH=611 /DNA_ID=CAMNT_0020733981 /DNA_START=127 /DNA_END=1962 /DNA_ORIENTATION=-